MLPTHIISSESSVGKYVLIVLPAYTGADKRRFVYRTPSINTRRSKVWVRKFASMMGGEVGSADCNRTHPEDWGFMTRQIAPMNSVSGSGSCPTNEGGVCC